MICVPYINNTYYSKHSVRVGTLYLTVLFSLTTVALTASTVRVYMQMRHMVLSKEKETIKIMTVTFDTAYILRAALNATVLRKAYSFN